MPVTVDNANVFAAFAGSHRRPKKHRRAGSRARQTLSLPCASICPCAHQPYAYASARWYSLSCMTPISISGVLQTPHEGFLVSKSALELSHRVSVAVACSSSGFCCGHHCGQTSTGELKASSASSECTVLTPAYRSLLCGISGGPGILPGHFD